MGNRLRMPRGRARNYGNQGQPLQQIEKCALNCDARNGQERAAVGEAVEAVADGPLRVKEDHSGTKGRLSQTPSLPPQVFENNWRECWPSQKLRAKRVGDQLLAKTGSR